MSQNEFYWYEINTKWVLNKHDMLIADSYDKQLPVWQKFNQKQWPNYFRTVVHSLIFMETCFAISIRIQSFISWIIARLWRNSAGNEILDFFPCLTFFQFLNVQKSTSKGSKEMFSSDGIAIMQASDVWGKQLVVECTENIQAGLHIVEKFPP